MVEGWAGGGDGYYWLRYKVAKVAYVFRYAP